MELTAALEALANLRRPNSRVPMCTDSRYVIDCCSKWMPGWKQRGWTRTDGALKNVELLEALDAALALHDVQWQWVAGHSGDPGNERADALAVVPEGARVYCIVTNYGVHPDGAHVFIVAHRAQLTQALPP